MWSYFTFGMFKRMVRRSDSCPLCRRKVFSNDGATNATNNNNNNNGRIIKIMEMYHHLNQVMPVPPPAPTATATATAAAVNAELQREVTEINDLLQNAENTIAPQEQPINTC